MDHVGNILQISGALMTKACQNCKQEFIPKVTVDELRQKYKQFKCKDCEFKSPIAQDALMHTIENDEHKLKAIRGSNVIGYKRTIEGIAVIEKLKDDYSILCKKCNDIN
jgi:DNA-directed RNA polymerase subunit RPC12/RpoP